MRPDRRSPEGAWKLPRAYRVAATVLLVLGALCLLVELQSPSLVYWTGERVPATNDGGIVFYTVHGEQRTLNDPRAAPASPRPTTVYADPDDSSRDQLVGPGRWLDAVFVASPFVAAVAVVVLGVVRRRRVLRRRTAGEALRPSLSRPPRGSPGRDEAVRRADAPPPSRSSRSRRSSR